MDRQAKTFLAVFTLMGSTFLTINHIVEEDPIEAWWLAGVLFFISMVFWAWLLSESDEMTEAGAMIVSPEAEAALPRAQEWIISKELVAEIQQEAEQQQAVEERPAAEERLAAEEQPAAEEPDSVEPPPVESEIDLEDDERQTVIDEVVENGDEADVVQDTLNGDPVAEAEIAEAEAAKPEGQPQEAAEVVEDVTASDEPTAQEPEEFKDTVTEPDDLTRIEGIGPKYRDALIEADITTYARLANLSVEQIETIAQDAGMRRSASMATWAEQARLAANNDWDALDALQEQLSGGRRD